MMQCVKRMIVCVYTEELDGTIRLTISKVMPDGETKEANFEVSPGDEYYPNALENMNDYDSDLQEPEEPKGLLS